MKYLLLWLCQFLIDVLILCIIFCPVVFLLGYFNVADPEQDRVNKIFAENQKYVAEHPWFARQMAKDKDNVDKYFADRGEK